MKKTLLLFLVTILSVSFLAAQEATVTVSKKAFRPDEKIRVEFKSTSVQYWGYVAIYEENQDIKSDFTKAYAWEWTNPKTQGAFEFNNPGVGRYFAIYRSGNTNMLSSELSERVYFYVTENGEVPFAKAETIFEHNVFSKDEPITFSCKMNQSAPDTWVAIYQSGVDIFSMFVNAGTENQNWKWIDGTEGTIQSVTLSNPGVGRWFVVVRSGKTGKYADAISEFTYFDVVERIPDPKITINSNSYKQGENVTITYSDMPGKTGDRLMIYHNLSKAALKKSPEITASDGSVSLGNDLLPGDYRVMYEQANGKTVGNISRFSVEKTIDEMASGSFKIGVMSDVHIMAPELVVQDGTAFQTYLHEDRKLLQESAKIAEALSAELQKENLSVLLVPGDLTKDGERASHELFVKTFKPLVDAGTKIIVVPGNHDINNPHAVIFNGDSKTYAPTVSKDEFAEIYRDFGFGQAISCDANSLSYISEPVNGLWVVALDVCKYYDNTFIKDGARVDSCVTEGMLKPATAEWLQTQAELAKKNGKQIIALLHHNVIEHFNGEAKVASPYLLDNYLETQKILLDAGISIVFTGHFHSTDIKRVEDGDNYLYEVETGSPVTYPCPYRIITVNEKLTDLKIDTRYIDKVDWNTDTLTFQEYSQKSLSDGIPNVMKWLVNDYYDYIASAIPEQYQAFITIPDRQTLGNMVVKHLAIPATNLLLTHNEGNENLKEGQPIIDGINGGIEALAYELAKIPGTGSTVASEIKNLDYYTMLQEGLKSILENKILLSSVSSAENTSAQFAVSPLYNVSLDDMYAHITLPTPIKLPAGYEVTRQKAFSVYPNPSIDGKVVLSIPEMEKEGSIDIYNIQGQQIATIATDKNTKLIPYQFSANGTYIVTFNGESKKIIIKQ